jgi:hypothetical protein
MPTERSGTPSRVMRTERVLRHGSPALKAALQEGEITLYRAGEIAKLPVAQQEIALTQWINRFLLRTRGQAIAARAIHEELTRGGGGTEQEADGARARAIDVDRVAAAIKNAIKKIL